MATVKGDVHDIGKNIVSVVLACNNFEIIDLGVMVPSEVILQKAIEENVDVIGLSGLITPSLDEMVNVAKEMNRIGLKVPLLIGGATTSKAHTAVKIAPQGNAPIIHVNDASRAVTVVNNLLSEDKNKIYTEEIAAEYSSFREKFLDRTSNKKYIDIKTARKRKYKIDWEGFHPVVPNSLGCKTLEDQDLETLVPYIDWTPFFRSWDLHGKYPEILNDEIVGQEATSLFIDAQNMLRKIIDEKWLTAKARFGLFPANSLEDDILVFDPNDSDKEKFRLITLRQQLQKRAGQPNLALADFIVPLSEGVRDYIGTFCVTTGYGVEEITLRFEKENDDYNSIMVKALADRLAEAFAEYLHREIRTQYWGYAPQEKLTNDELIRESYKGIRPAPGYPACPDHLEKQTLWELMEVEKNIGVTLTESYAMWPAASVSGYYFAHPEAKYFGLGKIKEDQLLDYSKRRKIPLHNAKKWLSPNLI